MCARDPLYELQAQDVLYSDEHVLAVNKPRGLPTRGRPSLGGDSLYDALLRGLQLERLWLPHHLDRVTSGVLVAARSAEAARVLSRGFEQGRTRKTYLAWVHGTPPTVSGRIDLPLTHEGGRPRVDLEHGKAARTRWRVLRTTPAVSLLYLRPHTGRTHQLRVHLRALGCPIVGDPIHGQPDGQPHCQLHALELHLPHPTLGRLRVRAPLRDGMSLDPPRHDREPLG